MTDLLRILDDYVKFSGEINVVKLKFHLEKEVLDVQRLKELFSLDESLPERIAELTQETMKSNWEKRHEIVDKLESLWEKGAFDEAERVYLKAPGSLKYSEYSRRRQLHAKSHLKQWMKDNIVHDLLCEGMFELVIEHAEGDLKNQPYYTPEMTELFCQILRTQYMPKIIKPLGVKICRCLEADQFEQADLLYNQAVDEYGDLLKEYPYANKREVFLGSMRERTEAKILALMEHEDFEGAERIYQDYKANHPDLAVKYPYSEIRQSIRGKLIQKYMDKLASVYARGTFDEAEKYYQEKKSFIDLGTYNSIRCAAENSIIKRVDELMSNEPSTTNLERASGLIIRYKDHLPTEEVSRMQQALEEKFAEKQKEEYLGYMVSCDFAKADEIRRRELDITYEQHVDILNIVREGKLKTYQDTLVRYQLFHKNGKLEVTVPRNEFFVYCNYRTELEQPSNKFDFILDLLKQLPQEMLCEKNFQRYQAEETLKMMFEFEHGPTPEAPLIMNRLLPSLLLKLRERYLLEKYHKRGISRWSSTCCSFINVDYFDKNNLFYEHEFHPQKIMYVDDYCKKYGPRDHEIHQLKGANSHYQPIITSFIEEYLSLDILEEYVVIPVPSSDPSTNEKGIKLLVERLYMEAGLEYKEYLVRHTKIIKRTDLKSRADKSPVDHYHSLKLINETELYGKSILLLDDIVTTGGSLTACRDLLQLAFPETVIMAALRKTR